MYREQNLREQIWKSPKINIEMLFKSFIPFLQSVFIKDFDIKIWDVP